jgi:hypothetical protein
MYFILLMNTYLLKININLLVYYHQLLLETCWKAILDRNNAL